MDSSLLKVFSSILWSLLYSVSCSFEKWGQGGRKWIALSRVTQLHIGFNVPRKLFLNFWNRMWLKPSLSFVISFKPSGRWQLKELFAEGLMKGNIHFLKIALLSEFFILEIISSIQLQLKRGNNF